MKIVSVSFTNSINLMSVQQNLSIDDLRVKDILDYYAAKYNQPDFITDDPISIPHQFTKNRILKLQAFGPLYCRGDSENPLSKVPAG